MILPLFILDEPFFQPKHVATHLSRFFVRGGQFSGEFFFGGEEYPVGNIPRVGKLVDMLVEGRHKDFKALAIYNL